MIEQPLLTHGITQPPVQQVIGVGLAAGKGERFRPLTLKAKGYLRAKAAVRFLGRRVLDWLVDILRQEGVSDFIMVTKGKENRYQIKSIIGYGDLLGVHVRYSPVRFDHENTGSADAILTNLEYFDLRETIFVFPTDSVLDIDLRHMLDVHQQSGAVATIATAMQPAESIADRYGLIKCGDDGRVQGFVEKPSLETIQRLYGVENGETASLPLLPTNAGFYLFDAAALRTIGRQQEIIDQRRQQFDIGHDLLPWLVKHGYPVHVAKIGRMGDLGNIPSYLETMRDALNNQFTSLNALFPHLYPGDNGVMIDHESMMMTDPITRLTLAEKIARGLVTVIPPVRVGKYVRIYPGVTLQECNIDDDCEIFDQAQIIRSSIGAGSMIGAYAYIEDTLTGIMVEVNSRHGQPVILQNYVAIGDEVIIRPGVTLCDSITIHPRLKIPSGITVPARTDVQGPEQILDCM